jgi:hypothetical protein
MFEYIVVYKWEILEYKLNPVFEFAFNNKKVQSLSSFSKKKKNKGLNSQNSLTKGETTGLKSSVVIGTPERLVGKNF